MFYRKLCSQNTIVFHYLDDPRILTAGKGLANLIGEKVLCEHFPSSEVGPFIPDHHTITGIGTTGRRTTNAVLLAGNES